jgi:TetR/AcrR family transcriptional regulator, fatty acid biosynthesis regulator
MADKCYGDPMQSNAQAKVIIGRRLSPEARRAHILDVAAQLIVDEGVSAVSMERLGRDAGISKALCYAYFENRTALLSQLLVREYPAFQGGPMLVATDESFESLIRRTTTDFIDRYVANGVLIQRLMHEPSVAEAVTQLHHDGRAATAAFFGAQVGRSFGVSQGRGAKVADLMMGITGSAARMVMHDGAAHDDMINMVVAMIVGAAKEIAAAETDGRL